MTSGNIIQTYPVFDQLTSVHINCDDTRVMISGYSSFCNIYDAETTQLVQQYQNIHENHINVSRFMHHNAHVFATSSFDKSVKVWDMRCYAPSGVSDNEFKFGKGGSYNSKSGKSTSNNNSPKPIYEIRTDYSIVMVAFSPNDMFLVAAGIPMYKHIYVGCDIYIYLQVQTMQSVSITV